MAVAQRGVGVGVVLRGLYHAFHIHASVFDNQDTQVVANQLQHLFFVSSQYTSVHN